MRRTGRPAHRPAKLVTFKGETLSPSQWAERIGIHANCMRYRLKHWPLDKALTLKPGDYNPRKRGRDPSWTALAGVGGGSNTLENR